MALDKNKVYMNTQINDSPTIVVHAEAPIDDVRCRAVKFSLTGTIALCSTAGEQVAGVAIITNSPNIVKDEPVDVQIRDNGKVLAGAAIVAGQLIATDVNGMAVPAVAGNFVFGMALTSAKAAGDIIDFQMFKTFYPATN